MACHTGPRSRTRTRNVADQPQKFLQAVGSPRLETLDFPLAAGSPALVAAVAAAVAPGRGFAHPVHAFLLSFELRLNGFVGRNRPADVAVADALRIFTIRVAAGHFHFAAETCAIVDSDARREDRCPALCSRSARRTLSCGLQISLHVTFDGDVPGLDVGLNAGRSRQRLHARSRKVNLPLHVAVDI